MNFKYVVASLSNLYLHLCLRIFTFSEMTHFVKYCGIVSKCYAGESQDLNWNPVSDILTEINVKNCYLHSFLASVHLNSFYDLCAGSEPVLGVGSLERKFTDE